MRIAIIAPPWVPVPPPAYGGTEAVLHTLATGLQNAGHEVLLYTTGDSTCPVNRHWVFDTARGIGKAGVADELRHVLAAYETVADYDIVHDHTLAGPFHAQLRPYLPVVTTNHGPFEGVLGPIYRAISDRVPVIAISHHQARRAENVRLAGVIHHGVDVEQIPFGSGQGGYALFLGRMHHDKGVHVAARVARQASIPLRIAGKMSEPHEREYFDTSVAPLLGEDIEYIGEVGGLDKLELVGNAICLLNPILWPEPFGLVMIEALAAGTPVITTGLGAAPEIITHGVNGYLAGDGRSLLRALSAAPEIDRNVCRRTASERFSTQRLVADHMAVYRTVAELPIQTIGRGARS